MRALNLLGRLSPWRWGASLAPGTGARTADPIEASATVPIAMYNSALDQLVKIAVECGAREERARIATIARLPSAEHFPRLALNLALTGVVTPDQAIEAFGAAARDAFTRERPTRSSPPESDGRILH